jgi:hypothetical protein
VRMLLRAAMVIFVVTIVIGILNGTDVWDPPRDTLLTHVHAGTLGWVTLGVFAGAIWMFGGNGNADPGRLPVFSIVALSLYVVAFWSPDIFDTTESIQRPIGGTLAFLAMTWMLIWVLRAKRAQSWNVAEFGMALSLGFLVFGAVLGVLLGLQLADVEIVDPANAGRLGESHPGAMVAGYVVLAGLALIEWMMPGRQAPKLSDSKSGVVQMLLLFVAGILLVIGFLLDQEAIYSLGVPLQIIGAIVLVARFRKYLAPKEWGGPVINRYVRTPVVGLLIVVGLIAYLISQFLAGAEFEEIAPIAITFDHVNFLMVITNLLFAMMVLASKVSEASARAIFWGLNLGTVGFAIGILSEVALLKRIFTPLLGVALLYALWLFWRAEPVGETIGETEKADV